jgi:VanZ family protein
MLHPERDRPASRRGPLFFLRAAGLVALCLVVILSILPGKMQIRTPAPKEFEHFVAYFTVASVLALGYRRNLFALAIAIFLIVVAGALEQVQRLIPGRTARLADWEASTMGVVIGTAFAIVMASLFVAIRRKKDKRATLTRVPISSERQPDKKQ